MEVHLKEAEWRLAVIDVDLMSPVLALPKRRNVSCFQPRASKPVSSK
jgi:hypothetical protein